MAVEDVDNLFPPTSGCGIEKVIGQTFRIDSKIALGLGSIVTFDAISREKGSDMFLISLLIRNPSRGLSGKEL
jgi:hypothetical protein